MQDFTVNRDAAGNITNIATALKGQKLLDNFHLNKDTAFSAEERAEFGLYGMLPEKIETIEDQVARCYQQYQEQPSEVAKFVYLTNLHFYNETLFYRLVSENLNEMMPIVYTPTVGAAIEEYSAIYRKPTGIYISYPNKDRIDEILDEHLHDDIDMILVTDSEGILGIGDQGVGGLYICNGKLAVYTLCAGVNPYRVLSVGLDVGTNNEKMLNDPAYLGWRHERVRGKEYDDFIDTFVSAVRKRLPNVFLHWEDFGRDTARANLERYQDKMCTFNDDMQGTGIVTLSALLSAVLATDQKLTEQRIIFLGAGTSATGIADQICDAMVLEGISLEQARDQVWMLGRRGLILEDMDAITPFQRTYAKSREQIADWELSGQEKIDLLEVVKNVKPTALIGVSTVANAFSEEIVKTMAKYVEHPIILPLSNPTSKSEAVPADVFKWTNNKALVATGSPFDPVDVNGKKVRIAQCNNAFAFPGLGLGVIAAKAKRITNSMIWAACKALTDCSPVKNDKSAPLLPHIDDVQDVSFKVALAVVKQGIADGVVEPIDDIAKAVKTAMWQPQYYSCTKK